MAVAAAVLVVGLAGLAGQVTPASAAVAAGPAGSGSAYPAAVQADDPVLWYQLDDSSGPAAVDSSATPNNGTYHGGVTLGVPGPTDCGAVDAVTLDGSSGYVSNANVITSPAVFSVEVWFKTTTTSGGLLAGFGNAVTGASTDYDRHIWMGGSGQVYFGVDNNQTVASTSSYNDGQWHQAVGTLGPDGLDLYIDGALVASDSSVTASSQSYSGSWRVGYDNLQYWIPQPSSFYFAGSLAEVSVYGTQLTAAQVAGQYAAAEGTGTGCGTVTPVGTACTMTGTLSLASGSLTLTGPGALGWSATANGLDQQLVDPTIAQQSFLVNDATASGAGWHVALSATQFASGSATLANVGTLSVNGSVSALTATTAPTAACTTGSSCTLPTDITTYPVAITTAASSPSSVTIYDTSAGTGLGSISIGATGNPVGWWLNVPSSTVAGSYATTITMDIVSGP